MINTNKALLVLTLFAGILVLSFSKPKDQFTEDYIEFHNALQNFRYVVEAEGDIASAEEWLNVASDNLNQWTDRMEMEAQSNWDSFEDANWPPPPHNWRCLLHCAYLWWKCKSDGEGDNFMCLASYNNCRSNC